MTASNRAVVRYGAAFAIVVVATLIRLYLDSYLGDTVPFITYFAAVALAGWYGGLGPSLLALALGAVAADYFFISPRHSLLPTTIGDGIGLVLYVGLGLAIALVCESMRATYRRAEEHGEWLRVTLASIGDAVIATDRQGRVSFLNGVAESLTGWGQGEAIGQTLEAVFRIVREETRQAVENPVARVFREGVVVGRANRTILVARDGTEHSIAASAAPIRKSSGRILGVVLAFRDITEERRVEREAREAKEAAEEANRAKDRFLAMLSHELRTPLNPVLMAATAALSNPETPPELLDCFLVIRDSVQLQARLIDDLLDVTRIIRGKLLYRFEVVDVHESIARAVDHCRSEAQAKHQRVTLDSTATHHHVNADPARLQQLLWNLLKNAIKFSPDGAEIRIGTRDRDGRLVVEVADQGVGIEPLALPIIFNAFEQGEDSVTRRFGGLGLGLAIGRSIAEGHGGSLTAASEGRDRGSTFTLDLPTVSPPTQADPGKALDRIDGEVPRRPLRILLVEDDPTTARMAERLLRQQGYQVTTANSIAEALGAELDECQVVVSDLGLPDGSGLDLMRRIKESRDIPGIALTGHGMDGDVEESRKAGFVAHLVKPVDFPRLVEILERVGSIPDRWAAESGKDVPGRSGDRGERRD